MWALTKDNYKGGIIPYCEHIYTDADMVMMAQLSWAPDRPADEILREYTRFEFSGAHVDSVIEAIRQNEAGNTGEAARILKSVEPKLTSYQRDSWRWRSFMCKATGANARAINYGTDPPRNRLGLAKTPARPTIASSEASPDYHAGKAYDGILSFQDQENFWASANRQDVGAWWQVDLGKKSPIEKIQIQFRGFGGRYHFVPKTITFQVSDDGKKWTTVVSKSANVPANNSAYSGRMYAYDIHAQGRYVRLLFEDGSDEVIGGSKVVELVEVKVGKPDEPVKKADEPIKKAAAPVKEVRVVLPAEDSEQMKRIASVFARQVEERCSAKVTTQGEAPLTVTLKVDPAIGKEGFRISDRAAGGIEVAGQNELGVLYGLGKLLRTSRYSKEGFAPGSWRGESVPKKLIRGIYFATHFHNFYHDGPVEEIQRYVEEIALWGCNSLAVWYDMHHFNGFKDLEAVEFRKRLAGILQAARDLGIGISLGGLGNEGYANSPRDIRSKGGKRGGYYDCQICPSKPGGLDYRLRIHSEIMDWMRPFKPEFFWIWPFDQGGCDCAQCRPWATRGFLKCAKPVAGAAREALPGVKIVLSNWYYRGNETRELGKILSADKPWVDYVMGPVPGTQIPAVNFPEISMLGVEPWGGYGAIPVPQHLQSKYSKMANLQGGWPYSEGLSEDMNKIMMLQLYWNPKQPVLETIEEYAGFEFAPEVAKDVVSIVKTLEKNFRRRRNVGADAVTAYALAQKVDAKLPAKVRTSWRWRILYLRALIDKEMHLTKGRLQGELLRDAFAELTRIYHAENALEGWLKPPQVK